MHNKTWTFVLLASAALAACGTTDLERGVTGAAIGAVVADVTGNSPVVGAAVGGSVGVICDDVTPDLCR